jgi:hypothetical protein
MSFGTNLMRGRSHIIFVLGIVTASAIIASIESQELGKPVSLTVEKTAPLTAAEREAAAFAWSRLPPDMRTAELKHVASDLGGTILPPRELSPASARSILLALHARHRSEPVKAAQ